MRKLVLVLFIISTAVIAQKPNRGSQGKNHEKIKALKTAHITNQLELTSAEAEKFWPIYNEYDAKLITLRKEEKGKFKGKLRNGGIDSLTDKEANEIIDKMLEMKAVKLEYRKELVSDLRRVISPKKIIKLQRAEDSFKRMLLERLKQKGKDKGKGKSKNKKK